MNKSKHPTLYNFLALIRIFGSRYLLVLTVVFTSLIAGLDITVSYLIKKLLDCALGQDFQAFGNLIFLLGVITILLMVSRYLRGTLAGQYTERGIAVLRKKYAGHLLYLPIADLERLHSGDLISRMTNDMNRIRDFTNQSLLSVIYQPLAGVGAFIYLLTLNWQLTLITTFGVPFIFRISSYFSKPIAQYTREYQEKLALVNKETQDTLNGIEVVRAYDLQVALSKKYDQYVDESIAAGIKVLTRRVILQGLSLFTNMSPFLICFGFGGYWVIKGQMTAGSLIAFITLLNPLTYPISQMPALFGELKSQMAAAGRVLEIIAMDKERETGEDFTVSGNVPVVEFTNVSFTYPNGEKVLDNVSFTVRPGEKLALIGPSGSGKSTVFNLILGYYEQYQGEIKVLGHPVHEWNLQKLRNRISLVAQDTYLFPGTIGENIAMVRGGVSEEEIELAAKAASADDFIHELQDGYNTQVGESGDKLSGGQKQRIAIARAIIKNAPLVLLDEATSSLDIQSESHVQKALDNVIDNGKASILISHRLTTIQKANRIIVLQAGKIAEDGTHEQLLANNGVYKSMITRQSTQEDTGEKEEAV